MVGFCSIVESGVTLAWMSGLLTCKLGYGWLWGGGRVLLGGKAGIT